ncbi:MAG: CocE/NonD family hydrolase, partial [Promethearchaeota archaeon]
NGYPGDPDSNRVEQFIGLGPYDQAITGNLDRDDVLVFTSEPLTAPLDVVGRIWAKLWVSSNCSDTAFTVMLMDQYPNGSCYNVVDGILVMRFRDGFDHEAAPMQPGIVYPAIVDLWSTAYQFNTGHRIKVAISSSNYPRFERHPNNAGPLTNHPSNFSKANNTILVGGSYDSCIILPRLVS